MRIFSNFSALPEDLDRVATWVEVLTGLTLDTKQGSIQLLDNEAWRARRERLSQLGGPPQRPGQSSETKADSAHDEAISTIAGTEPPIVEVGNFVDNAGGTGGTAEIAAFSPDGLRVLSGHNDGHMRLWDRDSGRLIRRFRGHNDRTVGVAFSPDGHRALAADEDKLVRLWDLETGKVDREFRGHSGWVFNVAFSPDGRLAYSTSGGKDHWNDGADAAVRVWDVETGREVRKLEGHTGRVMGLSVSPDGHRVLTGGEPGLILWDAQTGNELRRCRGHSGLITNSVLLPDRHHAVSGSWDRTIRIWDLDTGREIDRLVGHPSLVTWLAVSPDGHRLLSSDYNSHELRLWDLQSRRLIRRIDLGVVQPTRGAFSPDGRHAVWCGTGEVVRLYRLPALGGADQPAAPARPDPSRGPETKK